MTFVIDSRLPSLNDYITACRANRYTAAKFKADTEALIGLFIRQAERKGTLHPTANPVFIRFVYHEQTKKRDPDNIAAAKKFVLDALQKYGIIPNDSQRYIVGFTDEIITDTRDFVEVEITEKGAE